MQNPHMETTGTCRQKADDLAREIILLHPDPESARAMLEQLVESLEQSRHLRLGERIVVKIGSDPAKRIEVVVGGVRIAGNLHLTSPSLPGLHRRLPRDPHAIDRIRDAVLEHHRDNDTTLPPADDIRHDINAHGERWSYGVVGEEGRLAIPESVEHRTVEDLRRIAGAIVGQAEIRAKRIRALKADAKAVQKKIQSLLEGTSCSLLHVDRTAIDVEKSKVTYDLTFEGLNNALSGHRWKERVDLFIGQREWRDSRIDDLLSEQRRRHRKLTKDRPDRGLMVEAVLAAMLATKQNKAPVRKMLFQMKQNVASAKSEWHDISKPKIQDGCVIATIELTSSASWRNGRLLLKRKTLPHTVITALKGRRLRDVIEHPHVGDQVIISAKQMKEDLVIKTKTMMVPFSEVWENSGGD